LPAGDNAKYQFDPQEPSGLNLIATVRDRFRRWADAAGHGETLKTVRLPGRDGAYVVFAAAAPA
jgi:hypothetical protein